MSIRRGSFFERSKLTLQKWLLLMHWWAKEYPVTNAAEEVEVSNKTAIQVYAWLRDVCNAWLRDVCSYRLCNIDPPIKLGGQGIVVAIDESLFSHRFVRNIIIPVTHNIIRITEAVHLIRMYGYLVCVIPHMILLWDICKSSLPEMPVHYFQ